MTGRPQASLAALKPVTATAASLSLYERCGCGWASALLLPGHNQGALRGRSPAEGVARDRTAGWRVGEGFPHQGPWAR